jgi:rod shape-determining protein MreB and related proteins
MRLRAQVAIDLGTVNTLISISGRGIVVEEPSAIAVDKAAGRTVAVGRAADALAGKEPQNIEVIHPLREGVIADLDAASAMLQGFMRLARLRRTPLRPKAVVCVPSGATWVERRALAATVEAGRPRCLVQLIDEPIAAAAGAGFDLARGAGVFVVDVGGGTTEIAVVVGGYLVRAESLRVAGNAMDDAIVQTVKTELSLVLGRNAARRLKMALGVTGGPPESAEAVGVDLVHGIPRVENIPGTLVVHALEHTIDTIAEAVRAILLDLPPDVAEDLVRGKVCLAGGGALLPGLASRIELAAGIPALVVDDPLRCVVRGAAAMLERGADDRRTWH